MIARVDDVNMLKMTVLSAFLQYLKKVLELEKQNPNDKNQMNFQWRKEVIVINVPQFVTSH